MDDLISIAPQARGAIIGFYSTSNQVGLFLGASLGGFAIQWGGFEALSWLVLGAAVPGRGVLWGERVGVSGERLVGAIREPPLQKQNLERNEPETS